MTPPDRVGAVAVSLPAGPTEVERDFLHLGHFQREGRSLQVNSRYLELDGRPWIPVMGEFHYSRYPDGEWETELRKMHAGGVDVVASYVFWNHHEEIEGSFDWSGRRDVRRFVELAARVGLFFFLRAGPWVHGEARNGGFPDWLLATGELRCNDPGYLARVARLYREIGAQLGGLMWQDGGPVIGVQLENEYPGVGAGRGAEHIAELERLAIAAGLTVPLYTVTGWPTLAVPPREVIPVSGAYADGFWFGETGPRAPSGVFLFQTSRAIGEMGNIGGTPAEGLIDRRHYPFFLAEAGGGMQVSYHRRPVVDMDDVAATALVQIGSGANLYGYYMYHGGTNPPGRAGRLNETQESGYPNDVPVLGYDFRAPLGQYGQVRPSFGRLRALHQLVAAFGAELAAMDAVLPRDAPADPADRERLRVALRGAGDAGFLFVNNHVRHHPMPRFTGVRFRVELASGAAIELPARPVDIAPGACFIWPIGLRIGGAVLRYATLQPLTRWVEGGRQTLVLCPSRQPGLDCELCFEPATVRDVEAPAGWTVDRERGLTVRPPAGGAARCLVRVVDSQGTGHTIVIVPSTEGDECLAVRLLGRDRLVSCRHPLHAEGDTLVVCAPDRSTSLWIYPADDLAGGGDGFAAYDVDVGAAVDVGIGDEPAGPPEPIDVPPVATERIADNPVAPPVRMGAAPSWRGAVPLAPEDAHFEAASRWRLRLPDAVPADRGRVLLELDYLGDAARLYADGVLVDDHFFDGEPWTIGVDRFAAGGRWPALELRIVAAHADPPIFLEAHARRRLAEAGGGAELSSATITWWREARLSLTRPKHRGGST
ncbi:MAG TPA: beta-galactosidase [Kofleriaceae bacterium]|nr:beta-galactosidase [Kofleriaceae bacterium]